MSHLFYNCTLTQQLLKNLQSLVRGYLILPDLEPSIVILGDWNTKNENNVLVNDLILADDRTRTQRQRIHISRNYLEPHSLSLLLNLITRKSLC